MPTIPENVLQQRAWFSEQVRMGGPAFVAQHYPQFYSASPKDTPTEAGPKPTPNPTHKGQPLPLAPRSTKQPPSNFFLGQIPPRSCCQPKNVDALGCTNEDSRLIGDLKRDQEPEKPHTQVNSPTHYEASLQPHVNQYPNSSQFAATSMGTTAMPWTQDSFSGNLYPQAARDSCMCNNDCNCEGCLQHPYNDRMKQTIGSIANSSRTSFDHRGLDLGVTSPIFSPSADFDVNSSMLQSPTAETHPMANPMIQSTNYSHFEYDVTNPAFGFTPDITDTNFNSNAMIPNHYGHENAFVLPAHETGPSMAMADDTTTQPNLQYYKNLEYRGPIQEFRNLPQHNPFSFTANDQSRSDHFSPDPASFSDPPMKFTASSAEPNMWAHNAHYASANVSSG